MNEIKKTSRRKFFKIIASAFAAPFAGLWFFELKTRLNFEKNNGKIELPANIQEGVSFLDKIIIRKKGETIKIFSSKCTHLGCKINREIDGKLVCPCHGSQFDLNGNAVIGPAADNLKILKSVEDKKTGKIIVYV